MLVKNFLINADVHTVWTALFDPEKYKIWTAAFAEGSNYVGTLEKGNPIQFLDGSMEKGMQSEVAEVDYPKTMVFRHFYSILPDIGREEAIQQAKAEGWYGNTESYFLEEVEGKTKVRVEMSMTEEWIDAMSEMWDRAIDLLQNEIERDN